MSALAQSAWPNQAHQCIGHMPTCEVDSGRVEAQSTYLILCAGTRPQSASRGGDRRTIAGIQACPVRRLLGSTSAEKNVHAFRVTIDAAPVKSGAACLRRQTSRWGRTRSQERAATRLRTFTGPVRRLQEGCNVCVRRAAHALRQEAGRKACSFAIRSLRSALRPQTRGTPWSSQAEEASGERRRLPPWPRRGQRFCRCQPARNNCMLLDTQHG